MRVCIHRGTTEIGGTCVEIESRGKRIVLDIGLPLDAPNPADVELYPVKGIVAPDPSLLGVVISHPHQDHYGLAHQLPRETTFLLGEAAERILAAAEVFSPAGIRLNSTIHFEHRVPIKLGPFTVTPYLVDHSGYDAYAVLIEADDRRLFYTGDVRAHGRKAKLFEQLVRDPPGDVDVLLMEGTTIGRAHTESRFPTEDDLEARFVEVFRKTTGMPLVWCAGQNIDRVVTVFRACKKTGRQLIIDLYVAHILRATGNTSVPQAEWDGIRVFLPHFQRLRIKRMGAFDVSNAYKRWRIYPEELAAVAARSVMLFRPSMMGDIEDAGCADGAQLTCSIWSGYLERDQAKPLLACLERLGMPLEHVHTSGHASAKDLRRLRQAFSEAVVVPIHSEQGDRFGQLFGGAERRRDGEWCTVGAPSSASSG